MRTAPGRGGYVLQAGAFRRTADADRRKASLALLGIEARVETGTGSGGEVWHRVRIGPFATAGEAQAMRRRLHNNNIQSITLKAR
ncbi:MAG: SPOR domain-containing protein [Pseudomonadota bacterium]|nr:SPOR domain-containing protein [Pseudomonadota bacterium]